MQPTILQSTQDKEPYSSELKCLVDNIYYEARGEPFKGKVLVGRTTLNRVMHKDYPETICKVVYQPYQFSWTQQTPSKYINLSKYQESHLAAQAAVRDGSKALFFHNTDVLPLWVLERTKLYQVGNHVFYK